MASGLSALFSAACFLLVNACVASLQSEYENKVSLSAEYNLYWTYNSSEAQLYFGTEVQTLGWVGLGFTYNINTNMDGYDVAIGYLVPGTKRSELKVNKVRHILHGKMQWMHPFYKLLLTLLILTLKTNVVNFNNINIIACPQPSKDLMIVCNISNQ